MTDHTAPDVPTWEDEYLDRVSDRLLHNYDLEKDLVVGGGDRFELYGEMRMESEKHFFHPALSYANHHATEHLLVRRQDRITVPDLEALVELGHALADEWVEPDERHFSTEFIFVVVAATEPADDVRGLVETLDERTLLNYGFKGHYDVHAVVVVPDAETIIASPKADVERAFRLWEPIEESDPTWWELFTRRMQL